MRRWSALEPARAEVAAAIARDEVALDELRVRHRLRREDRRARRAGADAAQLHALDQESRGDSAERRRHDDAHRAQRDELAARARQLDEERARLVAPAQRALAPLPASPSRHVRVPAARRCSRRRSRPVGPVTARHRSSSRTRCATGWSRARSPSSGGDRRRRPAIAATACSIRRAAASASRSSAICSRTSPSRRRCTSSRTGELRILWQDDHLMIVSKPVGLLSVPGRSTRDSVETRLGATVVHRLDLDTSGLLVLAKDATTLAAMHRTFERREVDKRYIAWLDGDGRRRRGRDRPAAAWRSRRPPAPDRRPRARAPGAHRVARARAQRRPNARRLFAAHRTRAPAACPRRASARSRHTDRREIACTAAQALDCCSTPRRWRLPTLTRERAWSLQTLLHSKRHALPRARR